MKELNSLCSYRIKKNLETMTKGSFVYFMANKHNTVLYIGVTNHLVGRVAEHKAKINKGFTNKYNCDKLVYYETFDTDNGRHCT